MAEPVVITAPWLPFTAQSTVTELPQTHSLSQKVLLYIFKQHIHQTHSRFQTKFDKQDFLKMLKFFQI